MLDDILNQKQHIHTIDSIIRNNVIFAIVYQSDILKDDQKCMIWWNSDDPENTLLCMHREVYDETSTKKEWLYLDYYDLTNTLFVEDFDTRTLLENRYE